MTVPLCAGFIAGGTRGYQAGYAKWVNLAVTTERYSFSEIVTLQYKMSEFEPAGDIFDKLVDQLKKDVSPHVWDYDSNTKITSTPGDFWITVTGNPALQYEV